MDVERHPHERRRSSLFRLLPLWRRRSPGCHSLALEGALVLVALIVVGCHQTVQRPKPATPKAPAGPIGAAAQQTAGSWLTFGGNPAASQVNATEGALTTATVSHLHEGWRVLLPDLADERPILVRHMAWPDGTLRNVLYLTTDKGTLLALDAASGAQLWATTPKNNNPKYTKASPAFDPDQGMVYSYGLDGKVHRFRATTGQEMQGKGWPVRVTTMPLSEKISSALNLDNGYLYVTTASFSGDAPPYQGHMVAINIKTGAKQVFNSLCNDHTHILAPGECTKNGGGIWGRPGIVVDPATGHIFFTVSDANYDANQGGPDWGDSVIEMSADGSKVLDSYTPSNYASEAFQNRDLGSTAPVLLPTIPNSHTPYLAVQAGKEGLLRLLNRQNLSGQGGPGHIGGELQTVALQDLCPTLAQPVAWQNPADGSQWLFVATLCHIDAFRVVTSAAGVTTLKLAWINEVESTSPLMAGGVLFAAVSESLLALNPTTGHTLWSSALPAARGNIGGIHWESPIVIDGRLYCSDETDHLTMYQL